MRRRRGARAACRHAYPKVYECAQSARGHLSPKQQSVVDCDPHPHTPINLDRSFFSNPTVTAVSRPKFEKEVFHSRLPSEAPDARTLPIKSSFFFFFDSSSPPKSQSLISCWEHQQQHQFWDENGPHEADCKEIDGRKGATQAAGDEGSEEIGPGDGRREEAPPIQAGDGGA